METVKAIHLNENMGGAFGPRNIALDYANGEYLMFLDSDDTFTEDACETLYNKINEYFRLFQHFDQIHKRSYTNVKKQICR